VLLTWTVAFKNSCFAHSASHNGGVGQFSTRPSKPLHPLLAADQSRHVHLTPTGHEIVYNTKLKIFLSSSKNNNTLWVMPSLEITTGRAYSRVTLKKWGGGLWVNIFKRTKYVLKPLLSFLIGDITTPGLLWGFHFPFLILYLESIGILRFRDNKGTKKYSKNYSTTQKRTPHTSHKKWRSVRIPIFFSTVGALDLGDSQFESRL